MDIPPVEPKNYAKKCDLTKSTSDDFSVGSRCVKMIETFNFASANFFGSMREQFGVYSIPVGALTLVLFGTVVGVTSYRKKRIQLMKEIPPKKYYDADNKLVANPNAQLSLGDISKLFLYPASIITAQFSLAWYLIKDKCQITNWDHFVQYSKWILKAGPVPQRTLEQFKK